MTGGKVAASLARPHYEIGHMESGTSERVTSTDRIELRTKARLWAVRRNAHLVDVRMEIEDAMRNWVTLTFGVEKVNR